MHVRCINFVCVCMCVCVFARARVCVSVRAHLCVLARLCVWLYARMNSRYTAEVVTFKFGNLIHRVCQIGKGLPKTFLPYPFENNISGDLSLKNMPDC